MSAPAQDREYLYEVTVRVMVGLTIPPGHPEIQQSIRESTADYLANCIGTDPDTWDHLIDGHSLVLVSPQVAPEVEPCPRCGGSSEAPEGCVACCRDCGFPCGEDKDGEGFHAR